MILATTVYVEHPNLALVPTIWSLADVSVGVVSTAGTDPESEVHVFWVEAPDFDAFERRLASDPTVAAFDPIEAAGDRRTYRIRYSEDAILVTPTVTNGGGLVVDSRSEGDGWVLDLELQSHDALEELRSFAAARDVTFEVLELHRTEDADDDSGFGLTDAQTEALVSAYVHGYYDDPREITLEGLASLLDISQTAVSGRLRRGSARLVEEVLVEDEGDRENGRR